MNTAIARHAPITLWAVMQAFLNTLYMLFGPPEHVAEQHTLTTKPYRLLLSWVRAGEALMRRLLLIEAASYAKPNTRPLLRAQRKRTRKLMGFDADKPELWRVSFRCLIERRRPRRRTIGPDVNKPARRRGSISFHSAWPLAERYEALIRVFNAPAAYAARLARRLHATPHRAASLLAHPEGADHLIGAEGFADTGPPARNALRHFDPG